MIVEAGRELVKAEAVSALRLALATGQGVGDALRACWYRHPTFATALMTESLMQRFGPGCDVRLITAFIARLRDSRGGPPGGFPSREAEALIRGYLGELELLDSVDPGQISYPEVGVGVLGGLFQEWRPSPGEVDDLLARAETVLRRAADSSALVNRAEEDWFESGMPDSPFAGPLGEVPPERSEEE